MEKSRTDRGPQANRHSSPAADDTAEWDSDTIFREATLRICSSLDVGVALRRCLKYLTRHIPARGMNLCLFQPSSGTLHSIAYVSLDKDVALQRKIDLPKNVRRSLDPIHEEGVLVINRPETHPACPYILEPVERPDSSLIAMRLELEGEWLGVLSVIATGKDRFTSGHARLLSMLHEPFAMAMSNALRYQEIRKLKDDLAEDNRFLQKELHRLTGTEIIGQNKGLRSVMEQVRQVADTASPVLLLGETGVGKEVIAHALHELSSRRNNPFVKVNCGAIAETLIDSELFGHEKGAFTGAVARKWGRFERARKGTVFLDEIGELSPQIQVRLLRVLQSGEIERVGGTETIDVDLRIIAATHRDLEEMVAAGTFREDLWFRLNVFPISIPPLRDRKADIAALTAHFIQEKAAALDYAHLPELGDDALHRLQSHHWPGNVRELENAVEHALIRHKGNDESRPLGARDFFFLRTANGPGNASDPVQHGSAFPTLDELQINHIQKALQLSDGKIHGRGGAADLLSVKPTTLRYRMDKLGIPFRKSQKA